MNETQIDLPAELLTAFRNELSMARCSDDMRAIPAWYLTAVLAGQAIAYSNEVTQQRELLGFADSVSAAVRMAGSRLCRNVLDGKYGMTPVELLVCIIEVRSGWSSPR